MRYKVVEKGRKRRAKILQGRTRDTPRREDYLIVYSNSWGWRRGGSLRGEGGAVSFTLG